MMHFAAKMPLLDAVRQLQRQRGIIIIMTNASVQQQLVEFTMEQEFLE